jgi:hypothetical protein
MTTARKGVRGQRHAPASLYLREDPVPIVQEAGWAPGPVWTDTENLALTGIRSRTIQPVASRYTGSVVSSNTAGLLAFLPTRSEQYNCRVKHKPAKFVYEIQRIIKNVS